MLQVVTKAQPGPSTPAACSPTDPTVNANWYRRMALNQVGMFSAPKILYMTQTETKGGLPQVRW